MRLREVIWWVVTAGSRYAIFYRFLSSPNDHLFQMASRTRKSLAMTESGLRRSFALCWRETICKLFDFYCSKPRTSIRIVLPTIWSRSNVCVHNDLQCTPHARLINRLNWCSLLVVNCDTARTGSDFYFLQSRETSDRPSVCVYEFSSSPFKSFIRLLVFLDTRWHVHRRTSSESHSVNKKRISSIWKWHVVYVSHRVRLLDFLFCFSLCICTECVCARAIEEAYSAFIIIIQWSLLCVN